MNQPIFRDRIVTLYTAMAEEDPDYIWIDDDVRCGHWIDSVGNVRGCESMYDERFIEGNLRERSLESIWNDENAFAYNRRFTKELLTGACKTCEYGSRCAGGCRSYAYFVHGKMYEAPYCAKELIKRCQTQ